MVRQHTVTVAFLSHLLTYLDLSVLAKYIYMTKTLIVNLHCRASSY